MRENAAFLVACLLISSIACGDEPAKAAAAGPAPLPVLVNPYFNQDTPIIDAKLTDFFHPANLIFYANTFLLSAMAHEKANVQVLYVGNRTILNSSPQTYPNKTFLGYIAVYQVNLEDKKQYLRVSVEKKDDALSVLDTSYSQYIEGVLHLDDYFPVRASFVENYKNIKSDIQANPIWKALIAAIPDMSKAASFVPQTLTAEQLNKSTKKQEVAADPSAIRNTVAINTFKNGTDVEPFLSLAEVINDISYLQLTASDISLIFHGKIEDKSGANVENYISVFKFVVPTDELYVYLDIKKNNEIQNSAPYAEVVEIHRSLDAILAKERVKLDPAFSNKEFGNGLQNIFNIPYLNYMLVQQPIRTPKAGMNITVSPSNDKAKTA